MRACWSDLRIFLDTEDEAILATVIIIHQTHYEKSDWSRAFNQFTIACELDMITAVSAADIAFVMSSSMSAWLLSPLECSPQKQNGWTLRFCFWGWIMWKMYNKTIIEFGFRMISWIIKTSCLCYLPLPSASVDNTELGFDNSCHAQPHPIIVYYKRAAGCDTREFTKQRRQRQRERHRTKDFMSRTMAVHVRYISWYISSPSSAKQQRVMTKSCVVWRTWTTTAIFWNFYFKFIFRFRI